MSHVCANRSIQREMTVKIEAGNIDCYYESVQKGHVIDIEYQVIDGGHGDLDISFELHNSVGQLMADDYKKTDNIHRTVTEQDGDHRFCFDNSFSTFNDKTVFFELIVESVSQDSRDADDWGIPKDVLDDLPADKTSFEMKVEKQLSFFFFQTKKSQFSVIRVSVARHHRHCHSHAWQSE